ncbi:hemolysin family protein [Flectobacillus roseus]|uniref:Hemolysin family protein n=1 Tax=Flectobacillus roseus TaxID=502259 RepID=A0ABT6YCN5_9BACT|nr:hemolysin family protein [Flectobacillus roseus]MDI9861348.1 hemolysin family protein [Flectobacillus roseus]MDI9872373.1 hemolysin family protein [Flectobacillus roseus]
MELLIIFVLILINGIFSMSEIALVSARKARLESAAKKGDSNAKIALSIANEPNRFLSTVQIGITLIGILTGIFSGEKMTTDIKEFYGQFELIAPYQHTLAVTTVVLLITYLSLVFGELVPKRIGLTNPEFIAKTVARPMNMLSTLTAPFVWLLTFSSDLLIKILNIKPSTDSKVTEEEIKAIVQEGTESGEVHEIEQDIVGRVFSLGDRNVSSLMTHRNDVVFLKASYSSDRIREVIHEELHSLYPVYEKDKDHIIGVVRLKDLFLPLSQTDFDLSLYLSPPQFILENASAYQALQRFKDSKIHYGIVIDEYGQTQGIVTLNDLLEALVGNVSDFDHDGYRLDKREDDSWLIDGQYPLVDFLQFFDLPNHFQEYSFNTVAGLILNELTDLPQQGDTIIWQNMSFEIIDMDGAKVDKLLIKILNAEG